jgi:hypothetical protein
MGIERPRVAILSANEKVIDSLPSTKMADALAQRHWDNAVVYGPLSFDLAVDPGSVGLKGLAAHGAALEVAGKADILVCPCIDSANVLYKVIMQMVNYGLGTFAGITVGVLVPYVILSRADNVETKLQSLALCSIAAERMDMRQHRAPAGRLVSATPTRPYRVFNINPRLLPRSTSRPRRAAATPWCASSSASTAFASWTPWWPAAASCRARRASSPAEPTSSRRCATERRWWTTAS